MEKIEQSEYRVHGECAQTDPDLFFYERITDYIRIRDAKEYCGRCVVAYYCLQEAMKKPNTDGVWAGTTDRERSYLRSNPAKLAAYEYSLEMRLEQRSA